MSSIVAGCFDPPAHIHPTLLAHDGRKDRLWKVITFPVLDERVSVSLQPAAARDYKVTPDAVTQDMRLTAAGSFVFGI